MLSLGPDSPLNSLLHAIAKLPQISPREFEAAMASRPKLLVCSVEFLADSQVGGVDDPICQLFIFPRCAT